MIKVVLFSVAVGSATGFLMAVFYAIEAGVTGLSCGFVASLLAILVTAPLTSNRCPVPAAMVIVFLASIAFLLFGLDVARRAPTDESVDVIIKLISWNFTISFLVTGVVMIAWCNRLRPGRNTGTHTITTEKPGSRG